jgi:hypothetical protein
MPNHTTPVSACQSAAFTACGRLNLHWFENSY